MDVVKSSRWMYEPVFDEDSGRRSISKAWESFLFAGKKKKKSKQENSMDRPLVSSSGETLRRERRALNPTDPAMWHKVAAISGLAAVGLGAYGTHGFRPDNAAYKEVWQTASLFHLVHTAALVGAPITKHPNIFGALLTAGILAFSGSCYTAAYLEDRKYSFLAPFGGFAFIAAWASLLF